MPKKRRGVKRGRTAPKRGRNPARSQRPQSRKAAPRRTPPKRRTKAEAIRIGRKALRSRRLHEKTIRLVMARSKVSRKEAERRWQAGLRLTRSSAIFTPADEARSKLAGKFSFKVQKDGSLDTSRAFLVKKGKVTRQKATPAQVKRSYAAFLREARYRQIAELEGVSVAQAKRLVRARYAGGTREALVKVTYLRLSGASEKRRPTHVSDFDTADGEEG